MNFISFYKGSFLVIGQIEHKQSEDTIESENCKSHTSKKEQSKLIIKSILNFHGITDLENFNASGSLSWIPDIVNSVENAACQMYFSWYS